MSPPQWWLPSPWTIHLGELWILWTENLHLAVHLEARVLWSHLEVVCLASAQILVSWGQRRTIDEDQTTDLVYRWLLTHTGSLHRHIYFATFIRSVSYGQCQVWTGGTRGCQLCQRTNGTNAGRHRVLCKERCEFWALEAGSKVSADLMAPGWRWPEVAPRSHLEWRDCRVRQCFLDV